MQKELDIAIIGAGFAGIAAAIKLQEAGFGNFRIFEKTKGISGTWYDNSYPGAACDVPSHLYCYSFAPNPDWSRVYSPQGEIREYVENVVDRYNLSTRIQLQTEIIGADFDEKTQLWWLTARSGEKICARFVVWSVSFLGTPVIPDFNGLENFQGEVFHTARWDHSVDLAKKNVVIVGSAASALQIGPKIAPVVKSLTMFQRTANYVMPRDDRKYSAFEKWLFRRVPLINHMLRAWLDARQDKFFFRAMRPGSWVNRFIRKRSLNYLRRKIKDKSLRQKLTANIDVGCKRILISDDFYDMFCCKNVSLQTEGIAKFGSDYVETKAGTRVNADIVIMATGFAATEFMPGVQINGADGASLESWRKDLRALKGLMVRGFPNTFFMLGPNTGLGHSSMILMIESQLKYLIDIVTRLQPNQTVSPKAEAVASYNKQLQAELAQMVWATSCQSWYKRADGFIPTMWPRTTAAYRKMMSRVDWSELDVVDKPATIS